MPKPPTLWVRPDYLHAKLKDEEFKELRRAHATFTNDFLIMDPSTCTHMASPDQGVPNNPNITKYTLKGLPVAKTPQEAGRQSLNMFGAGVVSRNSMNYLKAKQDTLRAKQEALRLEQEALKAKEDMEEQLDTFMAGMFSTQAPSAPSAPTISPPKPFPGTNEGSQEPGATIGVALSQPQPAQEREVSFLPSSAPLAEHGAKRKRDETEVEEPPKARPRFDTDGTEPVE